MDEAGRFLFRQWPDGSAVFDRQLGDTHSLDPAASAVFLALEKGARERSALIATLSLFYPEATQQDLASRLDGLLEQLAALGLVKADTN